MMKKNRTVTVNEGKRLILPYETIGQVGDMKTIVDLNGNHTPIEYAKDHPESLKCQLCGAEESIVNNIVHNTIRLTVNQESVTACVPCLFKAIVNYGIDEKLKKESENTF